MKNKNEKTKVVALYARASSGKQKDKGLSTPAQLKEMKAYCKQKKWIIYDEYVDDGKTGTNDRRKAFQTMISLGTSKKPLFDTILVWKLDRFARDYEKSVIYKAMLRKHGVSVYSMTQSVNDDDIGSKLAQALFEITDEQYSRALSENVKRGKLYLAQEGFYSLGGYAPIGYKYDYIKVEKTTRRKLLIDEHDSEIVKRIFKLSLDGYGYKNIAMKLNEEGIKTRKGNRWTKQSIYHILTRRLYTGSFLIQGERFDNIVPAIISEKDFLKVQDFIQSRRPDVQAPRTVDSPYVLSGLLYCGHCGRHMAGTSAMNRHGTTYYYYTCQTMVKQGNAACSKKRIRKDLLEGSVKNIIEKHIITDENLEKMVDICNKMIKRTHKQDMTRRTSFVNEIKSLKAKIERIYERIESNEEMSGSIVENIIQRAIKHEEEVKEVKLKLNELDVVSYDLLSREEVTQAVRYWKDAFEEGSLVLKRQFLQNLIERITVKDVEVDGKMDNKLSIEYVPPFETDRGVSMNEKVRGERDIDQNFFHKAIFDTLAA